MGALGDLMRAAQDVADDRHASVNAKQADLDAMDAVLTGAKENAGKSGPALRLRQTCEETGVPVDHGRHLLQAYKKRAAGRAMSGWSELLTTCQFSAAPVGRFLLDLHGEDRDAYRLAETLCTARQILLHMQTFGEDYRRNGRVALPLDWLRQAGAHEEELGARRASHGVRIVLDRMLDRVDGLLAIADPLPDQIADGGLRRQFAVIHAEALHLARKLRKRDPLRRRVSLGVLSRFACQLHARKHLRRALSTQ